MGFPPRPPRRTAMANDTSLPTDVDALRAEGTRLRELVGPDEAEIGRAHV